MRTRAEIVYFNAGLDTVAQLAAASAEAMRARLVEKSTRCAFAIVALDAVAEEDAALLLPLPPDGIEPTAGIIPSSPPPPRFSENAAQLVEAS